MESYSEMITVLFTFGKSRSEISQRLRVLGMKVDQSTIAKWQKETEPGEKMCASVARAIKLLSESKDVFDRMKILNDVQMLLATVFALKSLDSLKDIAEFDLMAVISGLKDEGILTLTMLNLLEAITFAVTTGEVNYKKIAGRLKLQ